MARETPRPTRGRQWIALVAVPLAIASATLGANELLTLQMPTDGPPPSVSGATTRFLIAAGSVLAATALGFPRPLLDTNPHQARIGLRETLFLVWAITGLANLLIGSGAESLAGGVAYLGQIDHGRFLVASHGHSAEVSESMFFRLLVHKATSPASTVLCVGGWIAFCLPLIRRAKARSERRHEPRIPPSRPSSSRLP